MINYKKVFIDLNDQLKENNITLTVICVGGFVLAYKF